VSLSTRDLPTPALLLDLDLFEGNIRKMQSAVASAGKRLRPHAKAHKCVEIARRQMEAGAVGVCVATLSEMAWMTAAGIPVLLTTPVADAVKTHMVAGIVARGGDVQVVVDHMEQAAMYSGSAVSAGVTLNVLVDLDVGDHRTGIPCDERAVRLAKDVEAGANLKFAGLQAYSVSGSHTEGFKTRREHSRKALGEAIQIQRELTGEGLDASTLTGGSTGTWNIDLEIPEFAELQAGSYPLMDVAYRGIVGEDFAPAMRVLATVISVSHSDRVTVDAGFKAFATDRPFGPEPLDLTGIRWEWAGDEHGFLHLEDPSRDLELGDKVEFLAPHTDPTVNLHERIHVIRDDSVVDAWPLKCSTNESM
jgi:D-serine deaminase-like pyridoxal phosphate-dependent protein